MSHSTFLILFNLTIFSLSGCENNTNKSHLIERNTSTNIDDHKVVTPQPFFTVKIKADGVDNGKHIYTLIKDVLGEKSIEAPEFYEGDHTNVEHLYEDYDDEIGDHFVLTLHRDFDGNKGIFEGRQRNEFKVYGRSDERLKGFEGTTFEYKWKMKINSGMEVSSNFTHFFQLKPKGGDDGTPTLTITGAERNGKDVLEIRYQVPNIKNQILATLDWDTIRGKWLAFNLNTEFSDHGKLTFSITQFIDNTELISLNIDDIDLWIGESNKHYQRPKWGVVRSIKDINNLRSEEEVVRFADIEISRF